MTEIYGWLYDIEADDLYLKSTKVWYIRLKSLDGSRSKKIYPFRTTPEKAKAEFMEWVYSFNDGALVVGHNILGFDLWACWKLLGIKPRVGKEGKDWLEDKHVQFYDTYVNSMYLSPDNLKHSLDYLSSGSEDEKMDFRQELINAGALPKDAPKGDEFKQWHPIMEDYCDKDVEANIGVFRSLWAKAVEMYGDGWIHPSFRQMQKDYWLYSAQAYTGVKFDVDKAKALISHIEEEMEKLRKEVEPHLPPRPLKTAEQSFYRIPAKPWKKNGEFSTIFTKWLEKHNAQVDADNNICAYGLTVPIKAGEILPVQLPMEIDDNTELKDYFISSGWEPHDDFWNFKKNPDTGKPERDSRGKLIKTTPKIQVAGQICPNLLKVEGEIPKKVVKFLSYRNRLGVVTGWLNNWRIEFDGRISAEISGYAPTSRVRHRTVCNVPKADIKVLLGNEMRDLFTVDNGYWYVGTDAAALENRTLASYTYKYDDGKFARMQLDGDPHCYSEDTEILTESGWKTFGALKEGEKVAQWDNGVISFVIPSAIVWQDYDGEMVSVKSQKLDFLVTPNHRVVYKRYNGNGKVKVKIASELHNKDSSLRLPLNGHIDQPDVTLTDSEIRFIVVIQADGSFNDTAVRFEFKCDRKIHRFDKLMSDLGIEFSKSFYEPKGTTRYYVRFCQIRNVLKYLTHDKEFSNSLLTLSSRQADVFIDEIQYWDGTVTDKGDVVLDTTSKVSRDVVSTIGSLCGRTVSCSDYLGRKSNFGIHDTFRAYIPKKSNSLGAAVLGSSIDRVKYQGKIGCVSVPSTFVLVKRNGKILVSGNTFNAFAFFPHLREKFDISDPENKENPAFKPWRNKAKTGAYLLAFGGGAPKLAASLGLSAAEGKAAYDNYWSMNEGLGKLKSITESYFSTTGKSKYIPGKDGRLVSVRGKNVLLSCLGQGLGAICMSYAACFMDAWLGEMHIDHLGRPFYRYKGKKVARISAIHDEYSWEVEDGIQVEVKDLSVKAIVKAGEHLKLSLPLAAEGKMAYNGTWKEVH